MSQCQHALAAFVTKPNLQARLPLTPGQVASAQSGLRLDCVDWLYSAAISIADALRGLDQGFYTWATVKLYYAAFFSARAELALNDFAILYIGGSPVTLNIRPGERMYSTSGTTHAVVLTHYSATLPTSAFLSQPIDSEVSLVWLAKKRESVNYKISRAMEPIAPVHFQFVAETGVRKALNGYLSDPWHRYIFDPDHAMLAFPLLFWRDVLEKGRRAGMPDLVDSSEAAFLTNVLKDGQGPFSNLISLATV